MNYWDRIRAFYRANEQVIHRHPANVWALDMYAWEYEAGIRLTPIEDRLWYDIRNSGAVLYPQYPVGRFFVDFGNPVAKVAIECDGAAYHLDKEKDAARQKEIEDLGWTVYRIDGATCCRADVETHDDHDRPVVVESAATMLMRLVVARHGIAGVSRERMTLIKRAASTLLAHHEAGRVCDPLAIEWAFDILRSSKDAA